MEEETGTDTPRRKRKKNMNTITKLSMLLPALALCGCPADDDGTTFDDDCEPQGEGGGGGSAQLAPAQLPKLSTRIEYSSTAEAIGPAGTELAKTAFCADDEAFLSGGCQAWTDYVPNPLHPSIDTLLPVSTGEHPQANGFACHAQARVEGTHHLTAYAVCAKLQ